VQGSVTELRVNGVQEQSEEKGKESKAVTGRGRGVKRERYWRKSQ